MGCCASRSPPTLPLSVPTTTAVSNSDWLFYAPTGKKCCHCGQPRATYSSVDTPRGKTIRSPPCSSYVSSCSYSSRSRSRSRSSYSSGSMYGSSDYTRRSSHHSVTRPSPRPIRTRQQSSPLSVSQSRTYSLLSTPDFHSVSSHPRNNLVLNPELFSNTIMTPFTSPTSDKRSATHSTPRTQNSTHSLPSTPHPRIRTLTLNTELLHTPTASPQAFLGHDRRRTDNKLDTDCASRFSDWSLSSSSAASYPLPPLSVRTEPYPRLQEDQVASTRTAVGYL